MRKISLLPPDGTYIIRDLGMFGFPEIPYFAGQSTPKTGPPLGLHIHKNLMEICYFFSGERTYEVAGEIYLVRANHVFVAWPNELHGSGQHSHGKAGKYWLQINLPPPGGTFLGAAGEHIDALVQALWNLPRRSFVGDRRMGRLLAEVMRICLEPLEPEKRLLAANRIAADLIRFFLMVVDAAREKVQGTLSPDIAVAAAWIDDNPRAHPNLAQLAEMAHLSESRFKRKFAEQVGLSPGDYVLRGKVEKAKHMLAASGKNITEIALELGFSSHQHFSGTFSRYIGYPPSVYLSRLNNEQPPCQEEQRDPALDALIPRYKDGFCHGYFTTE